MKKWILTAGLIMGISLGFSVSAQVKLQVNLNIQPAWGPSGYDYVEYYYLPDLEMYYYVPGRQYVYMNNGRWVWTTVMPSRCRAYNFDTGYKVVLTGSKAYLKFHDHQRKYARYKNYHGKKKIIKSKAPKQMHRPAGHHHGHPGKGKGNGHGYPGKGRR